MIEQRLPYSSLPSAPLSTVPALSDPPGATPLVDGALWVQHALLGTTATVIAVLAIAAIGFLALSGRIDLRRGATTIIGCFILFGAPSIAAAFVQMFEADPAPIAPVPVATAPLKTVQAPPPPPSVYDPYAGASVQRR